MDAHPLHRRDAIRAGYTDHELRRLCRAGWTRLRPGTYLPPAEITAQTRHLELIRATLPALAPDAAVSHQSALLLDGLPVWGVPLDRVHVTRNRNSGGRIARHVHVHAQPLSQVREVAGLRTVAVARAYADLARTASIEASTVSGDAILRERRASWTELAEATAAMAGRKGFQRARTAVALLDARSESPGESRSRIILRSLRPQSQAEIFTEDGRLAARADFVFPGRHVIGEFDGRVKYGRTLEPGSDPAEVVYQEKLREDRLRGLGWTVVRWNWAELAQPARLVAKVSAACDRAARAPAPRGTYALAAAHLL